MMNFFRRSKSDVKYDHLTVPEYAERFADGNEAHTLVDVRTRNEFNGGHLPGAMNIPLSDIGSRTDDIPTDKPIVVVCASGNRSKSAANKLTKAGFDNVYNLKGGTMKWMMQGHPLE
jgi:rhodanese-related sulfurtransferase